MIVPRLLIGSLSGGGGKTLVSAGLVAALRRKGFAVAPFKKGPDYIDAAWLSQAAGTDCRNLDLFLMSADTVRRSFLTGAANADLALIEGNRGLFDGADARGTYSSAELAKVLRAPVVLVVDCAKTTRTAAALVLGCQRLDPAVAIRGVILNRTAGARHEAVLREAIESACGLYVLGALPRLDHPPFTERHLGLLPPAEHGRIDEAVAGAADLIERHVDLDAVRALAKGAPPLEGPVRAPVRSGSLRESACIGVFRDAAFQFYYAENLEALRREGARLIDISPLADSALPDVDALYIGGGFPETLAERLAANGSFRESLRLAVHDGLPVYAECGGAVYLGTELVMGGVAYAMAGALPAVFGFGDRPNGHGYAVLEAVQPNPFFDVGESLRGHEFHYTYLESVGTEGVTFVFRVRRGHGFDGQHDGLCYRNALALYTHIHALGVENWAPALVGAAVRRHHCCAQPGGAVR
jgi:cobyrinic acid a,c-diamide synthase